MTVELKAAHRLLAGKVKAQQIEQEERMRQLCELINEPGWMTLTASILAPNVLTASTKVEALDLWKKVQDLGMVKKLTGFIEGLGKMAKELSKEVGLELKDIISAFQTKPMLAFFKTIKFSLKVLFKPIKAFSDLYREGILKVFAEIHKTKAFQKLHSGAMQVDEFLDQYPVLKKLAGPAIAGLLLWMWLSGNFTGNPAMDMDLSAMLNAALHGHWSAAELFTSKEGLAAIALLLTGLATPWPSPVWLQGALPFNLMVALCYTAFKHAPGSQKLVNHLKPHMKFGVAK